MFRKSFVTLYHTLPVLSQKGRYCVSADKLKMHAHAIESRADIAVWWRAINPILNTHLFVSSLLGKSLRRR